MLGLIRSMRDSFHEFVAKLIAGERDLCNRCCYNSDEKQLVAPPELTAKVILSHMLYSLKHSATPILFKAYFVFEIQKFV